MFEFDSDAAFDIEKTSEYILSIQVSLDGFSFSVVHPGSNRLLAFMHTALKISSETILARHFEEWIGEHSILQHSFRKTRLVVFLPRFSLIPQLFYEDSTKEAIAQIFWKEIDEPEIAENYVESLKARLIFTLPTGFNHLVQRHFSSCEIIHPLKLLINNLPETTYNYSLNLLFDAQNFYAILRDRKEVLLVNNFKAVNMADVVYFAHNILQQFDIAPQHAALFLSASCQSVDTVSEELKRHFPNVYGLEPSAEVKNPELASSSFLRYFASC